MGDTAPERSAYDRREVARPLGSDVTLVGVTAPSNRQKSDQDPATWMPAPAVHCRYVGEWVATRYRWGLAVEQVARESGSRLPQALSPGVCVTAWSGW